MEPVRIRCYDDADFAGVDALWQAVFPDDPPWNRAAVAVPAKRAVQPELFLVAVEGDRVVGTVTGGYDGHRGWVYALAVAQSHRRRGVASRLVTDLETRLAEMGCGKLNLQVRASNAPVVAFYRALGYTVEERISMGKRLASPPGD